MKITLFTSNQNRHVYLINKLAKISKVLNVVLETRTIFTGAKESYYKKDKLIKDYFKKVNNAEKKIFDPQFIDGRNKNINILPIQMGDLKDLKKKNITKFLNSDIYIVFGSTYIKGDLVKFLVKNKAINIHMGVSPYYRGTDCNFWALHDKNPQYVGATIHYLTSGLDSGPIIYHALSKYQKDSFMYSMSTAKSAIDSLVNKIQKKTIYKIKPTMQNKKLEVRYSKLKEFNKKSILKHNTFVKKFNFNKKDYIHPIIFD